MAIEIDVARMVRLFDQSIERWHAATLVHDERDPLILLASKLNGFNFQIWHEEDDARAENVDDAAIGQVKRRIDPLNQARNDAMEAIDEYVLKALVDGGGVKTGEETPLHSETVGSIVDRLSILSLKAFHMAEETRRDGAGDTHRKSAEAKLAILREQRGDLAGALSGLVADLDNGRKRFKVYRQMKMYNDPAFNPVLYGKI